jgi:hypothetical protein
VSALVCIACSEIPLTLCYRGVVAVTMKLLQLDINQCPDKFYVPNAFKDTHKCDKRTSYVSVRVPILSFFVIVQSHSSSFTIKIWL